MTSPEIKVLEDPVQEFTDELLVAAASGGHVALTGGSTPRAAYERAAGQPEAFAGARLWFGDERCVPPDDERSNFGMVKQALLDPLAAAGVQPAYCQRMEGELGHRAGAEAYARELQAMADSPRGPEFALILLGIGPDGHIASMFPGQPSLTERDLLVVGVPEAGHEPFVPRISFTFPALARAQRVLLMATGSSKADAVASAFGADAKPSLEVPASLLAEHVSSLTVLLDAEAAGRL